MPSHPVHRPALLSRSSYGKSASTHTYLTLTTNNNQAYSTKMVDLNAEQDATVNSRIPKKEYVSR